MGLMVDSQCKDEIRQQLFANLEKYGIVWDSDDEQMYVEDFRHSQYLLSLGTNPDAEKHYPYIKQYIATPSDIDIHAISPRLEVVDRKIKEHRHLWSYATSGWSVPVTAGFGRRMRFFVFDDHNDKLIGIFGLCDPVIGLKARDIDTIGWTKDQKLFRLYNCMTAYVLGAVSPYNAVLGGKLVALTLMFPKVRKTFYHKYKDTVPIIGGVQKKPYLAYIDTLGAFGKSAVYNRLYNWQFAGYTKGQSHIHITANGSWELLRDVVPEDMFMSYKFGKGPNWKMRVLKRGLRELGLSRNMLSIGWKRGYYTCPLAENWQDFLLGNTHKIKYKKFSENTLVDHWKQRWVIPRYSNLQEKLNSLDV